jgi:hypothetical protein
VDDGAAGYTMSMDLRRRTWIAALRLAAVLSVVAGAVAAGVYALGDVPQVAIVVPVIVIAFAASWVQTGRIRRAPAPLPLPRRRAAPIA